MMFRDLKVLDWVNMQCGGTVLHIFAAYCILPLVHQLQSIPTRSFRKDEFKFILLRRDANRNVRRFPQIFFCILLLGSMPQSAALPRSKALFLLLVFNYLSLFPF